MPHGGRTGWAIGALIAACGILQALPAADASAGPRPAKDRSTPVAQAPSKPEPVLPSLVRSAVALQIALEAQGYSPGLVDGSPGPKTRIALAAFQEASGLKATGEADEATLALLKCEPQGAFALVTLGAADVADVDPPPKDWIERSRKRRLLYPSLSNLIAERAHTTERFVSALNTDLDPAAFCAGSLLWVPAVKERRRFQGTLERIEIDLERRMVLLFAGPGGRGSGKIPVPAGILFCSIAADPAKAVPGESKVAAVAANPTYTFDPAKWPEVHGVDKKLLIPPGPRNPVGLRWIGLEREGVGIHGAPEPEMIGKTGSHGCFRLTNWDAIWLADLVQVGTPVKIIKSTAESAWRWRG